MPTSKPLTIEKLENAPCANLACSDLSSQSSSITTGSECPWMPFLLWGAFVRPARGRPSAGGGAASAAGGGTDGTAVRRARRAARLRRRLREGHS